MFMIAMLAGCGSDVVVIDGTRHLCDVMAADAGVTEDGRFAVSIVLYDEGHESWMDDELTFDVRVDGALDDGPSFDDARGTMSVSSFGGSGWDEMDRGSFSAFEQRDRTWAGNIDARFGPDVHVQVDYVAPYLSPDYGRGRQFWRANE
jgi:hypothetical protein